MEELKKSISEFFSAYEIRFNDVLAGNEPEVEATTQAFAESFLEASPEGVICTNNDDQFREQIPKGYEFYKSIGTQSMEIWDKEITIIDSLHTMVKVYWRANYLKADNSKLSIDFKVTYFLQQRKDGFKIFAYITGDEAKVLKAAGLT